MIKIMSLFNQKARLSAILAKNCCLFTSFSDKIFNQTLGQLHEVMVKKNQKRPINPNNISKQYLQMRWKFEVINKTEVKVVFTKNVMTMYKRIIPQIQQKQGHLLNIIFDHKCQQQCEQNPPPKTFPKLLLNNGGVVLFQCKKCKKIEVLFDSYNWVIDEQGFYQKDMDNEIIGLMANIN